MPATAKPALRLAQTLVMPLLVTAILVGVSLTAHEAHASEPVSVPTVQTFEPVTKLKKKPIPLADRFVSPVSGYRLTARFGASGLWASSHTGLDFAAPTGTAIRSITSGVVTEVAYAGSYGYRTIVRNDDGVEFWYCHQTSTDVGVGQRVMPGDFVGTVGSTGNVTGPHLHLEVRPGPDSPVDPFAFLAQHGVHV
ncbi:MAG TPA: M23 family metallopeptidase [Nocardioidaceae bacterium]|nr:M23 family metallopeptidase [Nocardioidaceae bacterium]